MFLKCKAEKREFIISEVVQQRGVLKLLFVILNANGRGSVVG